MTSTQTPKKVEGIGPTTRQGMPISLRSVRLSFLIFASFDDKLMKFFWTLQEVTDMNREQWYKNMYNTIHKAKDDGN